MFNYNHDCPFEAFITNLGKYNEGLLVGEWVKFPVSKSELIDVFERIGIGEKNKHNQVYDEYFITDYDIYVSNMSAYILGENASIECLNILATSLNNLSSLELNKFECCLELENNIYSIKDYLEIIRNLDDYILYENIHNEFDLGYSYISDIYTKDNNYKDILDFVDYEKLGSDLALRDDGLFTEYGYLVRAF